VSVRCITQLQCLYLLIHTLYTEKHDVVRQEEGGTAVSEGGGKPICVGVGL